MQKERKKKNRKESGREETEGAMGELSEGPLRDS